MSYTKGQLVHEALEELGIADYDFDIIPAQEQSALRKLDALIMEWAGRGVLLGYPMSADPSDPDPDEDSNLPDIAYQAVITNLALRIAPGYGKAVNQSTAVTAKSSLNTLMAKYAKQVPLMQLPSMPKGAGYKSTDFRRWTDEPEQKILVSVDENIDPSRGVE